MISTYLVQYLVVYAVCSHLNRWNSFSRYRASLEEEAKRSQKINNLPILGAGLVLQRCSPVELTLRLLMKAHDNA